MRDFHRCLAWLTLLSACGGGAAEPAPKSAADEPVRRAESESVASDTERPASDDPEPAPAGPRCDDGTCTPCGSGICPAGWYCDEKASACSWLAECAAKPSCSCITRVLGAGCRCDASSGAPKVACD